MSVDRFLEPAECSVCGSNQHVFSTCPIAEEEENLRLEERFDIAHDEL